MRWIIGAFATLRESHDGLLLWAVVNPCGFRNTADVARVLNDVASKLLAKPILNFLPAYSRGS